MTTRLKNRTPRFRRQANLPLILGLILVGVLVFLALFGPALAPQDPMETHFIAETSDGEFVVPPFKPGQLPDYPLGSDFEGRDLLSRLLWAFRPTLILTVLVAAIRLVVGTLLGLLEGWYGGLVSDVIASLRRIAQGMPVIIFAMVIIYVLGFRFEGWVFILALTLTGWASTTRLIAERTRLIQGEAFIEASRALGARDGRLLFRHVLPQVRTLIAVTAAFEMSTVLLQLSELGFLGFYLGGGAIRLIPRGESAGFIAKTTAGIPELGQMLSAGWDNFFLVPWLSVIGGSAFFLAIFSFMLLGEGLKRTFAEKGGIAPVQVRFLAQSGGPVWAGLWSRSRPAE